MVAELRPVQISGLHQGAQAAIPPILCESPVITDNPSRLMGLVVAAECRTGGDADDRIKMNVVFHQHVDNSRAENASHGTALQNQRGSMLAVILFFRNRFFCIHIHCYSPRILLSNNLVSIIT